MKNIIFVAGPSGAGKTSVVGCFSNTLPIYIEDIKKNPFLDQSIDGKILNAFCSQLWFLNNMENALINGYDSDMLIDQDPSAIIYVYAKYFKDKGIITELEYQTLELKLNFINTYFQCLDFKYSTIYIDASAQILKNRVSKRDDKKMAMPWFEEIHNRFYEFYKNKTVIKIDTTKMELRDVIKKIEVKMQKIF